MSRTGIAATLLVATLFAAAAGASAAGVSSATPAVAPIEAGPVARLLAKDSGQSVAAVLALKQQDGTWQAVEAALKLQPAEVAAQLAVLLRGRTYAVAVVATLAKLSGKTPADVRALKKKGVTWSQVAAQLGVTWQTALPRIRAAFQARRTALIRAGILVATLARLSGKTPADVRALEKKGVTWSQVAAQLGVTWQTALPQIRAAFQARQTALLRTGIVVATLAKLSGKTPADVRALKKKGVTWSQVAAQLGVNWQTALPQIRQRVTAAADARIRAAAIVGLLAKLTGKSPLQVRGLQKPGMTWLDVAHSLGVR